ncbi:MAG: ATP-grasp domain-containing protein, partial [Elusimicrobia bacterium]|nr:ATP-grasp domain-containing protein [Elusimicrobiota bacterium]
MKKRILLLAPSAWDVKGIDRPELQAKYEFIPVPMAFYQTHPLLIGVRFDILRFIAKAVRLGRELGVAGIVGTHDYPASLAAAAIAAELGLPGPAVDKAIVCQHKYLCRLKQRDIVPEAAPAFGLIDAFGFSPRRAPLEFPIFVKPVKATLSMFAGEAGNERELAKLIKLSPLERLGGLIALRPFNCLIEAYTDFKMHANYFIAEEVLRGAQVTVEGFAHRGRLEIMGVVDSVMYPGTLSFERFEYPSRLPLPIQERMESLALRLMSSIGFDDGCFNVEMIYNAGRESVHIIEVNPRMCSQFSDLYEKVDGTSGHAVQMAIASGERPSFSRRAGK